MKPAGLIARGAYDDDAERTRKTVCRQCKTVCRGIRRCLLREMLPRRRHIQVFRVLCEGKIHHPSRWAENCCSWDSGPCWSAVLVPFTSRPLSPCCCSQAMRWPRSPTLCASVRAGVWANVSSCLSTSVPGSPPRSYFVLGRPIFAVACVRLVLCRSGEPTHRRLTARTLTLSQASRVSGLGWGAAPGSTQNQRSEQEGWCRPVVTPPHGGVLQL